MLEDIIEVFEFQGNLVKFEKVLKHYEEILKELEDDYYE